MVLVLKALAEAPRDNTGNAYLNGQRLSERTSLTPQEINDAVTLLEQYGFVERLQTLGSAPYMFFVVQITSRGRYEFEQMQRVKDKKRSTEALSATKPLIPVTPVGSPYGFTDEDWEAVTLARKSNELLIVFGYQFKSKNYETDKLISNIHEMFEQAVKQYNQKPNAFQITLAFKSLAAGYGEHQFNKIARDIISSDIAIFDTSDLNSNVMIEMGVALTWGIRVLPIRNEGCPKPPSDISGQTWAEYRSNGQQFIDPQHGQKLIEMVDRAAKKKQRGV